MNRADLVEAIAWLLFGFIPTTVIVLPTVLMCIARPFRKFLMRSFTFALVATGLLIVLLHFSLDLATGVKPSWSGMMAVGWLVSTSLAWYGVSLLRKNWDTKSNSPQDARE